MKPDQITSSIIIGAACMVHTALGPGLLEEAYKKCLIELLRTNKIQVLSEVTFPIVFQNIIIETGFRVDLLVEDLVIVELKAVETLLPVHKKQLLTYLRASKIQVGLLINFNVNSLMDGVVRLVNKNTP